jgi:addiction module HigA family antidote
MLPEKGPLPHPGEILLEEFLKPLRITQARLAKHAGISLQRVNELVNGKRGVTPDTAWVLAQALGTTPEFWMDLQTQHDLSRCRPVRKIAKMKVAS